MRRYRVQAVFYKVEGKQKVALVRDTGTDMVYTHWQWVRSGMDMQGHGITIRQPDKMVTSGNCTIGHAMAMTLLSNQTQEATQALGEAIRQANGSGSSFWLSTLIAKWPSNRQLSFALLYNRWAGAC